jgi:hypothetical protein
MTKCLGKFIKNVLAIFSVKAFSVSPKTTPCQAAELHPRFDLGDMRCPICKRRPHGGLTNQLGAAARNRGFIACSVHGPVEGEIVIAMRPAGSAGKEAA